MFRLIDEFLKWVESYFQKDGKKTSEVHCYRSAMRVLNPFHGESYAT